jgi:hypothetical protein
MLVQRLEAEALLAQGQATAQGEHLRGVLRLLQVGLAWLSRAGGGSTGCCGWPRRCSARPGASAAGSAAQAALPGLCRARCRPPPGRPDPIPRAGRGAVRAAAATAAAAPLAASAPARPPARRPQVELQRKEASRAQRLLDEVLDVMGDAMDSAGAEKEQRRQEAAARLRQAFTGGAPPEPPGEALRCAGLGLRLAPLWGDAGWGPLAGARTPRSARSQPLQRRLRLPMQPPSPKPPAPPAARAGQEAGVDIFAAAAALAAGQSLAPEDLASEQVPAVEFLAEATELLGSVKQQQQELQVGPGGAAAAGWRGACCPAPRLWPLRSFGPPPAGPRPCPPAGPQPPPAALLPRRRRRAWRALAARSGRCRRSGPSCCARPRPSSTCGSCRRPSGCEAHMAAAAAAAALAPPPFAAAGCRGGVQGPDRVPAHRRYTASGSWPWRSWRTSSSSRAASSWRRRSGGGWPRDERLAAGGRGWWWG